MPLGELQQGRIADAVVLGGLCRGQNAAIACCFIRRIDRIFLAHKSHAQLGPVPFTGSPPQLAEHPCDLVVPITAYHLGNQLEGCQHGLV